MLIAMAAFVGLFAFEACRFPLIILSAADLGLFPHDLRSNGTQLLPPAPPAILRPGRFKMHWGGSGWRSGCCPLPPWLPLPQSGQRLADIGLFFSKLAVLTFGGAYAVLAWMAQDRGRGQSLADTCRR